MCALPSQDSTEAESPAPEFRGGGNVVKRTHTHSHIVHHTFSKPAGEHTRQKKPPPPVVAVVGLAATLWITKQTTPQTTTTTYARVQLDSQVGPPNLAGACVDVASQAANVRVYVTLQLFTNNEAIASKRERPGGG